MNPTLTELHDIAREAAWAILDVYEAAGSIDVSHKADDSPLTAADRRAHNIILQRLQAFTPDIPVLSEESAVIDYATRRQWQRYWLVDPLDGTKEFIKRNGEFTVNIALIQDGEPVSGLVHVPVTGVTYLGEVGASAWKSTGTGDYLPIAATPVDTGAPLRVVASRSHRDARLDAVIARLESTFAAVDEVSMGSSLKICLLAEGAADFYPRLAPTSEWDTAAAHAVLAAAGGEIYDTSFRRLAYNHKDSLLNPFFLAFADPEYDWQALLGDCLDSF